MSKQKTKMRKKLTKEVKKIVILTNIRDIIHRLLKIMRKHIGEDNKISRNNMFKKVYGMHPESVSELQEWMMWEFIKKAMHRMRQRTYCFIVSKPTSLSRYGKGGVWHYWVANSGTDYIVYRDNIERNIRAMRAMVKKCDRAIRLRYYDRDWEYK